MISRIICFLVIPSSLSTQGVNDYKIARDQWNAAMEHYQNSLKILENTWSYVLGQGNIIMEPMGRPNPKGNVRNAGPKGIPVYEYNLIDEDPQTMPQLPGEEPTDPFRTKNWGNPGLHRMRQPHFEEFNQNLEEFERKLNQWHGEHAIVKQAAVDYERSSQLMNHAMCRRLSDPFDKFVNAVQGMCSIFEAYNGDILDQHLLWVKAKLEEVERLLGE